MKPTRKKHVLVAACIAILTAALAAYHFRPRSNIPSGPAKITQISQWNKAMNHARLSPDGHAVAFDSPVGGVAQVFLMLTSGGEPLQLTNDEGDKFVTAFRPTAERSITRGFSATTKCGPCLHSEENQAVWYLPLSGPFAGWRFRLLCEVG